MSAQAFTNNNTLNNDEQVRKEATHNQMQSLSSRSDNNTHIVDLSQNETIDIDVKQLIQPFSTPNIIGTLEYYNCQRIVDIRSEWKLTAYPPLSDIYKSPAPASYLDAPKGVALTLARLSSLTNRTNKNNNIKSRKFLYTLYTKSIKDISKHREYYYVMNNLHSLAVFALFDFNPDLAFINEVVDKLTRHEAHQILKRSPHKKHHVLYKTVFSKMRSIITEELQSKGIQYFSTKKLSKDKRKHKPTITKTIYMAHTITTEDGLSFEIQPNRVNYKGVNEVQTVRAGPVFEEPFYKDILLNNALIDLHWSCVPNTLHNMSLIEFQCHSQKDVQNAANLKRMLKHLKTVTYPDITPTEANMTRDVLTFCYANCPEITFLQEKEHPCSRSLGLPYITHPTVKFPAFDAKHFQIKHTRTQDLEPLITVSSDEGHYNLLYDFAMLSIRTSKLMTISRIKSILRSALDTNQDPLEIILDHCPLITEKMLTRKVNIDDVTGLWGFRDRVEMTKYSWFLPYIPGHWYNYWIRQSDTKATNLFATHLEFFNVLRPMIIALRDNIIQFAKHYIKVYCMTPIEKKDYDNDVRSIFATFMRSQQVQLMFAGGSHKQDVENYIYHYHYDRIRQATNKTETALRHRNMSKTQHQQSILASRTSKFEQQQCDIYDEVQSAALYKEYIQPTIKFTYECLQVFTCLYIIRKSVEISMYLVYKAQRAGQQLHDITVAAQPLVQLNNRVTEAVAEAKNFLATRDGKMPETVQLQLVEINAAVHIVAHLINKDYKEALKHCSYLTITRANQIKEIITSLIFSPPAMQPEADNFPVMHGGIERQLTLNQYIQYQRIFAFRNEPGYDLLHRLEEFFNNLPVANANDEMQAGGDAIDTWIRPISKIISTITDGGLDERTIRDANAQYQLMSHKAAFAQDQYALIKAVISLLGKALFNYDPYDPTAQSFVMAIYNICDFTETHYKARAALSKDNALMREVVDMYQKAVEINRNPSMSTLPHYIRTYYMQRFQQLENLHGLAYVFLQNTYIRDTPTTILFTGPPGVGKTTAIESILELISSTLSLPSGPESQYIFNCENEFHEGYAHQPFVMMDDMFKYQDIAKNQIEFGNIIQMVNSCPYNMPMAFESKGAMFFDSQFIFCSTNYANDGVEACTWKIGATDKNAFLRRMHIIAHRIEAFNKDNEEENTFRIDRCDMFPELIGSSFDAEGLAIIMLRVRQQHAKIAEDKRKRKVQLHERMGANGDLFQMYATKADKERLPHKLPAEPIVIEQHVPLPPARPQVEAVDLDEILNEIQVGELPPGCEPVPNTDPYEFIRRTLNIKFSGSDINSEVTIAKIKYYTLLFGALIAFTTATSCYFWWTDDESQGKPYRSPKRARLRSKRAAENTQATRTLSKVSTSKTQTQSDGDNYMLSLSNNVSKCIVSLYGEAHDKDTKEFIKYSASEAFGFHYHDGYIFTPAHFWHGFKSLDADEVDITLHLTWATGSLEIPMPELWDVKGEDLYLFKISSQTNLPKSLRRFVWKDDEMHDLAEGMPMNIVSTTAEGQANIKPLTKAYNTGPTTYTESGQTYKVDFCINYYELTRKGESGSLITIRGSQGVVKVIGMHVCLRKTWGSHYGFALPISQDGLDSLIKQIEGPVDEVQNMSCDLPFKPLRTVPIQDAHYPACNTRLREAAMHGWAGETGYAPARLKPFTNKDGELINPLIKSMEKLRTEHTKPTEVDVDKVMQFLQHTYPRPPVKPEILTWEEALQGLNGPEFTSVNGSTSAGYPWNKCKKKGKAAYIKLVNNRYEYEPEFLETMKEYDNQLRAGKQIEVIWADALKDETRTLEKVAQGKTRLFSACPIHYLILVRRYFGTLIAFMRKYCTSKPCCVGINPHSTDWTSLYHRLKETAGSVIAGDFANYDGSLPEFIAAILVAFINWWYQDEHEEVRRLLCYHLMNAVHICFSTIYQTRGSHPTGDPITSEWNTLIQLILWFIVLTWDFNMKPEDWNAALYGDDNVITTKMVNLKWSDFVPHFKRRFDMDYTHWSKDANAQVVEETLETINFIGRAFVDNGMGIKQAPLTKETIYEMWYWIHSQMTDEEHMIAVSESYFSELSHYPLRDFENDSKRLLDAVYDMMPHMYEHVQQRRKPHYVYQSERYYNNSCQGKMVTQTQSKDSKFFEGILTGDTATTRNTEYTDRAMNDPNVTQDVELGSFKDVSPIEDTIVNKEVKQKVYENLNMETFDFNKALERVFNLQNVAWSTTQAAGTILASFAFPDILFNQPFLADKIKDFKGFVAGIQMNLRITASRTLYGKLMLVYIPFKEYYTMDGTYAEYVAPTNIYQLTGSPHILADASAGDTVTLQTPFVSPHRYLDLTKYGGAEMGKFYLIVFNPLTNSENATATATVVVTAGFVEAKLVLPLDVNTTALRKQQYIDKAAYVEDTLQSKSSLHAKSQISKNIEGVNKLTSADAQKQVTKPLNSALKTVSLVGSAMGNFAIEAAKDMAYMAILGLSKPGTMNTSTVVTANSNFNVNNGKGVDTVMKLAVDNENNISTEPVVAGISTDEMNIQYFSGMPSMVTQITLLPGSTPIRIATTGTDDNLTFCDHLKLMFANWSGSHKIKTYITASIFHDVRLVFYMAEEAAADFMVCYHQIVQIQGATEVQMTLPYCPQYIAQPGVTTRPVMSLFVKILAWSQSDTTIDTPIYLNTYKAGAIDFRVGCPKDVRYEFQSNPRMEFAEDFPPIQESITGYEQTNLIFGEEITSVREMIHKLTPLLQLNAAADLPLINTTTLSTTRYMGVDLFAIFYRWWRGAIRFKFMGRTGNVARAVGIKQPNGTYLHGVALPNPMMNSVEGEAPYYSPVLFENTKSAPLYPRTISSTSTAALYYTKGAGDDFSFHWIVLPAPGVYTANSVTGDNGYAGIIRYYGT